MATAETRVNPELEEFNQALDAFLRASRRARGRMLMEADEDELSLSQYHLLDPLERAGVPLPVGEVAVQAGVSAPSATRSFDWMERAGYVLRERQPGDRRLVHVRITKAGRRAVEAKRALIAERRAAVFGSLSAAQRKQAARVLSSLAEAMEHLR